MKRASLGLIAILTLMTTQAFAWDEKPVTLTEGRVAVGWIESTDLAAVVGLTMGDRSVGTPPNAHIEPVREACVQIVNFDLRLIDEACGATDLFVDDLFTVAQGADTFDSIVVNEWGQEIATSKITFTGAWSRDALTCQPVDEPSPIDLPFGYRTYASAPVFPALEAEARTQCSATTTLSLGSEYLGSVTGSPGGLLGLYAAEAWRGPQQNLP